MSELKDFLVLKGLNKSFADVQAVKDLSVTINKGELISFIGPSGCGKTTLLRLVGGFHEADSGEIILEGERIDHLPPEKRQTGMVFQNYALFPHMTVYQNVEYGLKIQKLTKKEIKHRVETALRQVQLDDYALRRPSELSGGQQQRVAIARCLVLEPKVLLLDEPLSNLDAKLRVIMREEIRRLKDELNLTIIFVTHDQEEALSISDRVVILNQGEIQQIGSPEEIYNEPTNEFSANFVGSSNILIGSVKMDNNQSYFHDGNLSFPIDYQVENMQEDQKILVRPERIKINNDSKLKGEIIKEVYNGNYIRYHLLVGGKEVLVDKFNVEKDDIYERGSHIGIEFPRKVHFYN